MSLLKRGGVFWNYYYIDGVRYQRSTGTGNRRMAELIAQKQREETNAHRHHILQVDPDLTFGALAARFLANGRATVYHVQRLKRLLGYFSDLEVVRLTKGLTDDYRQTRRAETSVSDATVNRDLSVLRRILNWGADEGLLLANPLGRLRLVRERRIRRIVVSLQEEQQLLIAAPEHIRRLSIAALDTGMRRGELLNQLWEDVDLSRRLLSVTKSKTPEGESREIPLTNRLFELLQQTTRDSDAVFSYKGQPILGIKTAWKRLLKRAGLRHIRFHDLRHTFNTRLMEAGVLQEIRMALMGHSSGARVHSIYTHIELPVKREAIVKLQQWVEKQQQDQNKTNF